MLHRNFYLLVGMCDYWHGLPNSKCYMILRMTVSILLLHCGLFQSVIGMFYLLAAGLALALVVAIGEHLYKIRKRSFLFKEYQ